MIILKSNGGALTCFLLPLVLLDSSLQLHEQLEDVRLRSAAMARLRHARFNALLSSYFH